MNIVEGARERDVTIIRVGNSQRWQTHLQELCRQLAQLLVGCVLNTVFYTVSSYYVCLFVCLFVCLLFVSF
jgi:hypothetical protein